MLSHNWGHEVRIWVRIWRACASPYSHAHLQVPADSYHDCDQQHAPLGGAPVRSSDKVQDE
jgi:hypothetical protein